MSFLGAVRREVNPFEFFCSILGLIALVLAIPVVLLAGVPFSGWWIGAALWLGSWVLGLSLTRFAVNLDGPQAIGVSGMSFMVRAWLVFGLLFVIAAKYDRIAGLTAAGVFVSAFTFDLMGRTMLHALHAKSRQAGVPE